MSALLRYDYRTALNTNLFYINDVTVKINKKILKIDLKYLNSFTYKHK